MQFSRHYCFVSARVLGKRRNGEIIVDAGDAVRISPSIGEFSHFFNGSFGWGVAPSLLRADSNSDLDRIPSLTRGWCVLFGREQYKQAQDLIDCARELLDTELTALSGESYQRAYGAMVSVQMLAELEEVIQYKLWPERRTHIRKMWWQRLQVAIPTTMNFRQPPKMLPSMTCRAC